MATSQSFNNKSQRYEALVTVWQLQRSMLAVADLRVPKSIRTKKDPMVKRAGEMMVFCPGRGGGELLRGGPADADDAATVSNIIARLDRAVDEAARAHHR